MLQGLVTVANEIVHQSLTLYYENAAHRIGMAACPDPEDNPIGRPLVFFRGMLHFEPAAPYLETLEKSGFAPAVFRFGPDGELNHLRQWRENTVDAIRSLSTDSKLFERNPVFVGHSAGGFTVYVLAAMARGASLAGLQRALPDLDMPEDQLRALALRLRRGRFIAISSPLNGVHLTRTGRLVNRWAIEPRVPLLFSGITQRNVDRFYQKLGLTPDDVLDGNILSIDRPFSFHGGPTSVVSHAVIQGGMRVFSPFLDHNTVNDGIVPLGSAFLEGPRQMLLHSDHLKLVETPEAARALVSLIQNIER